MLMTEIFKGPNPQAGDVYINPLAPNFAIAYFQEQAGLHTMFADCPVDLQGGQYTVFSRGDLLRVATEIVAPGGNNPILGIGVDTSPTYFCNVYAAEMEHTPEALANWSLPIQAQMAATRTLARAAFLRRELTWTTNFFTTGKWLTDVTPSVTWDDPSSDPIGDIETGIRTILLATGIKPNVLGLGYDVWKALKNHPDIVARIGTGSTSNVTPRKVELQLVANLFGLDEIMVGETVYNTAAAGASASMAFTAGKNALLAYRTPTPSLQEPTAGLHMAWRGLTGGVDGLMVRNGVDPRSQKAWYQIKHADDYRLTASELGYFFNGAVS